MYAHALATLPLAEMYGMDRDPKLEEALRNAVDLIVRSQSPVGGWRYEPTPAGGADMSVTVMQIVALRAANNAEIPVPAKTISNAIRYVRACGSPNGGFGYQGPARNTQLTGAGMLSLQLLGQYDDVRIKPSAQWLLTVPTKWGQGFGYFNYGHYYAMQAMYQAGGKFWNAWHPPVREIFLERQNADGSWTPIGSEGGYGPVYGTPFSCPPSV